MAIGGRDFWKMHGEQMSRGHSLCVGLDPEQELIPPSITCGRGVSTINQLDFIQKIVKAIMEAEKAGTEVPIWGFKINPWFFLGGIGDYNLLQAIQYIREKLPRVLIIIDAKVGEVKHTNLCAAGTIFDRIGADAVTLNPYVGGDAFHKTFLNRRDKGIFIWCRSSDRGSGEFQDRMVLPTSEEAEKWGLRMKPILFYQLVAYRVSREWNKEGNCGLIVGANMPAKLRVVRKIAGDMLILTPGIGIQGGKITNVVRAGINQNCEGRIPSASRSIIFASRGENFATAAVQKIIELGNLIKQAGREH